MNEEVLETMTDAEIALLSPSEEQSSDGDGFAETPEGAPVVPIETVVIKKRRRKSVPKVEPIAALDGHCPACLNGQSLEEGEGTHILATIEHPVVLPAAFQDADASEVAAPKPAKVHVRAMAKELRVASSFAEKNLPKKITEKAKLLGELARCEAEIQEYVRVIQALKGQVPVGIPNQSYQPNGHGPYTPPAPQLPPMYSEYQNTSAQYQQPAPVMPVVTPPQTMRAGGAGALDFGFLANE